MKCILVFNHLNDIIYTKYNKKFAVHVNEFARIQGLLTEKNNVRSKLSANIIVQLFSPIVTSQRVMSCQFGNSYTSIQCQDGLNMTFEEYMGYLFVSIGREDVSVMKRFLSVCVTLIRFLCGPDVLQLKNNPNVSATVTRLIDSWIYLHNNDQAVFVEAVEQLIVNSDLSSLILQILRESVEKLTSQIECTKIHAMILVQDKFLALYSSQNANELSPTDILFSTILCESAKTKQISQTETESETDSDEEFYSPSSSPMHNSSSVSYNPCTVLSLDTSSYQVLLAGNNFTSKCVPHVIHISPVTDGVQLLYFLETGNSVSSSCLYSAFTYLHIIQTVQIQQDIDTLRPAFDNLDTSIKKLCDSLKKIKNSAVESCYKQLLKKWDFMRKKYLDFIKNSCDESLLRAETSTAGLLESLKELLSLTSFDQTFLVTSQKLVSQIAVNVSEKLTSYNDFLKVKAMRNFCLGSDSLTINKYLEEFPGLVHFLYIDRTSHRVTAPTLDFNSEETNTLTKKKIWSMVNFSRSHLQEGHLSIMWKDTTFNYAYFLWFEDTSGSPLKPTIFPTNASKALPQPGILCGDFYQKLKEACFPKMPPNKIRCYELFCIHLGLATASCVLEHTRRLAATIWELRGHPNHPIDLL